MLNEEPLGFAERDNDASDHESEQDTQQDKEDEEETNIIEQRKRENIDEEIDESSK